MLLFFFVLSIMMLAVSIYLRLYIGRRNFYRSNAAGVQEFRSYGHMMRNRVYENFVHFIIFILTLFGSIILIACIAKHIEQQYADKPAQHTKHAYHIH